jgi:hypothetical protein
MDAKYCLAVASGGYAEAIVRFLAATSAHVTSRHESWAYSNAESLPNTGQILATLCDMRLPLTFSLEDCSLIGTICECVLSVRSGITS